MQDQIPQAVEPTRLRRRRMISLFLLPVVEAQLYLRSCSSKMRVPLRPQAQFGEPLLDRLCLPCERNLVRAHVRRHQADEVVRSEQPREQFLDRAVDVVCPRNADVAGVEKNHEHAAMRIGRQRVRLGGRLGFDPLVLRAARCNDDVLERFDFLRDAVLGDLEVLRGQILDNLVVRRIGIDPDEIRAGLELGWSLRLRGGACCWGPATRSAADTARKKATKAPRLRRERERVDTADLRGKLASSVYRVSGSAHPAGLLRDPDRFQNLRGLPAALHGQLDGVVAGAQGGERQVRGQPLLAGGCVRPVAGCNRHRQGLPGSIEQRSRPPGGIAWQHLQMQTVGSRELTRGGPLLDVAS